MVKLNSNIEKKILDFLEMNEVISEVYQRDNYIYIITNDISISNNINNRDDRYSTIGGRCPLKFDIEKDTIKRIHYLDFPVDLLPEEELPNEENIFKEIKNRKYINEDDIFNFLLNKFPENFPKNFNLLEINENSMRISFDDEEIKKIFDAFFVKINAEIYVKSNNEIEVLRNISPAGPSVSE